MSCFPTLKWPNCTPNPANGVYECSPGSSQSCCLSPQTTSSTTSNCPAGWTSAAGEWCTDVQGGIMSTSLYRHKCKAIKCANPLLDPITNCTTCLTTCKPGQTLCTNGMCTSLMSDNANCGACGKVCPAGTACSNGVCAATCKQGQTLCASGTCASLLSDNVNCGACGKVCPAGTSCAGGVCAACATTCKPGQTLCANGMCTSLLTDNASCGACGQACPPGTACSAGVCATTCKPGQTLCSNGMCASLLSDNVNCGACGRVCPAGKACSGGVCK